MKVDQNHHLNVIVQITKLNVLIKNNHHAIVHHKLSISVCLIVIVQHNK